MNLLSNVGVRDIVNPNPEYVTTLVLKTDLQRYLILDFKFISNILHL